MKRSSCIPCGNLAVGTPPKEMSFFLVREVPVPRGDDFSGFQVYYMVFVGKIWESPVIL